jgi:UDP-N-acetylglucosamine 2-epimerase (non-hydrolysing)
MKITIVAGARPNFMKIAPITRAVEAARAQGKLISYRLVYTGKQNDTSLDASLFSDLGMKAPDAYLGIESGNSVSLAAGIMIAFEKELTENPAHVVLVVDDLTATMSCAIVAVG